MSGNHHIGGTIVRCRVFDNKQHRSSLNHSGNLRCCFLFFCFRNPCWLLSHQLYDVVKVFDDVIVPAFAVGDSAGAHLLAQYACVRVNPEYAAHFSLPDGPLPRAVGLHCGTYEIGLSGSGVTPLLMTDYLPNRGLTKARRLMNLYPFITDRFPPAFLMTANDDIFKAQALKLSRRLTEQDVPFMFRLYGSREHRLDHVFHCDIRTPDARLCNDETCAFFFGQMEKEE